MEIAGTQAVNEPHPGVPLDPEMARVGGKVFDITALGFGINRVEASDDLPEH